MVRIRKLFRNERASGLLMLAALLAAMAAANSPIKPLYDLVHHTPVHVRFGSLVIEEPLVGWVNDGLMALFFLVVGLEIKRQFLEGHLSSVRCAALPVFAALGGMAVPAAIYVAFTWGDLALVRGWAVPTATDIVLALGILSLLGSRVPAALKVFLTALAVFDDIGAVLIIGAFYGEELALYPLAIAGSAALGLAGLNAVGIRRLSAYAALGLVLWAALLKSGIEAALAGVLIGLAVPLRTAGGERASPLRHMERRLHPWTALGVVPLFAFFNAGIPIDAGAAAGIRGPASLGIVAGLFVGKQAGVMAASWLAVRCRIAELPQGIGWRQIHGVAMLAGIGFTMSLFIATLAFPDPALRDGAKLATIVASLLSAATGIAWLQLVQRAPRTLAPEV